MLFLALFSMLDIAYAAAAAILGIDYGSEFVKSSLVAPNAPFEIVLTPGSQRKDASGLVIKPGDGERFYGSSGLGMLSKFPGNSFYSVKPLLGVPYDDLRVALFQETHPGLELVPTNRNTVAFNASGIIIPVEEIVAMQINDVKERATQVVREKTHSRTAVLRDIAISVPGHFGSAQRQALVDSVELLNADLVGLVSDGVAVAINYANSPAVSSKLSEAKHYVVVYDSGASSTTSTLVSLKLRAGDDSIVDVEVEGFGSTVELSGRAMTTLLRELLVERFFESHKPVQRTPRLLNRLWLEAERAKHVLSANTEVFVHVESLADDADLNTKITRKEFEDAANDMLDQVVQPLRESLGSFSADQIDSVVLVGGATRTPFLLEHLKSEVGEAKLSKNVNADEANVQGTCMRGINLSGLYRSKRKFDINDKATHVYQAHIKTKGAGTPEYVDLFAAGSKLGNTAEITLPNDIVQLEVYEDSKKLVSWDLPYTKKTLDALYESGPFTCVDKAEIKAKFSLDNNGVFKLDSIDAVCNAIKTPSTSSTTDSITASSAVESAASDAEATATSVACTVPVEEPSTSSTDASPKATSTESDAESSNTSAVQRPKTRRVGTQVSWVQAPIGAKERLDIRAHLSSMDKSDDDRKMFSVLHHELESLAYRIRGMVQEGASEHTEFSSNLLTWIDEGSGSLNDLKKYLGDARKIIARAVGVEEEDTTSSSAAEEQPTPTSKGTAPVITEAGDEHAASTSSASANSVHATDASPTQTSSESTPITHDEL